MPGPRLDGASVYELLESEGVTLTAAVPTVWLMLLQHLEQTGLKLSTLKRVLIGGSACPRSMIETFEKKYGVDVVHAWGMTEMSPLGTLGTLKAGMATLPHDEQMDYKCKQGHPPFGVEMKLQEVVPEKYKLHAHHWLILHGRYICKAPRPSCDRCIIADLCQWPEKTTDTPPPISHSGHGRA